MFLQFLSCRAQSRHLLLFQTAFRPSDSERFLDFARNDKECDENNSLVGLDACSNLAPMISATSIKDALKSSAPVDSILVQGWVRTRRDSKTFSFIELNDGSSLRSLQIIANDSLPNYAEIQRLTTGASIAVHGKLVASQGKGQSWEVVADQIEIVGPSDESYPLQKKGHTPEFLREIAHLRPRSNLFGCGFPRAQPARLCHSPIFSGARLLLSSTRRSSPAAIAKARANSFASPRSI